MWKTSRQIKFYEQYPADSPCNRMQIHSSMRELEPVSFIAQCCLPLQRLASKLASQLAGLQCCISNLWGAYCSPPGSIFIAGSPGPAFSAGPAGSALRPCWPGSALATATPGSCFTCSCPSGIFDWLLAAFSSLFAPVKLPCCCQYTCQQAAKVHWLKICPGQG